MRLKYRTFPEDGDAGLGDDFGDDVEECSVGCADGVGRGEVAETSVPIKFFVMSGYYVDVSRAGKRGQRGRNGCY